jgi:haloacetate dehalogenase
MIAVMDQLGFSKFSIAGHDRGGRVAYRLALDYPDRVKRLSVLDIVPTIEVWDHADKRFAIDFWPWSFLSQPGPLPERMVLGAPDAIVDDAITNWGSSSAIFEPEIREAYIEQFRDPFHIHSICEEYRASVTLDYKHDAEDRKQDRRIQCPVLVLWSAGGPLDTWYNIHGGTLAIWRKWADAVQGWSIKAGHFFPEEAPEETADVLMRFFRD